MQILTCSHEIFIVCEQVITLCALDTKTSFTFMGSIVSLTSNLFDSPPVNTASFKAQLGSRLMSPPPLWALLLYPKHFLILWVTAMQSYQGEEQCLYAGLSSKCRSFHAECGTCHLLWQLQGASGRAWHGYIQHTLDILCMSPTRGVEIQRSVLYFEVLL